jgi:carbonic anhydrase
MSLVIAFVVSVPLIAQEVTADSLWQALLTGNRQYVAGTITYDKLQELRELLKDRQMPPVTVLACSDSRVPPELVFNQSLGALFVVRTAGSVADDFGLATIEYMIANGHTRVIVVLGHENCGAVREAVGAGDAPTPSLQALLARIRTSLTGVVWGSLDAANLKKAVEANTRASATWLAARSRVIRESIVSGKVKVIPAYYAKSGEVTKIDSR